MAKKKENPEATPENSEKKKPCRNLRLLLYPDCPEHVTALQTITESGWKYACILHDKDIKEDQPSEFEEDDEIEETASVGELKKAHWHVVINFANARHISAIAKELGIPQNYVRTTKSLNAALLYLVHRTEKSKHRYQYDLAEVDGPLQPMLANLIDNKEKPEAERVLEIVDYIDSIEAKVSYRKTLVWACQNGLYSDFRKLGVGITYLIQEHNETYYQLSKSADQEWLNSPERAREHFAQFLERSDELPFHARCAAAEKYGLNAQPME